MAVSWKGPSGGGGVRQVQQGSFTITSGNLTQDITISPALQSVSNGVAMVYSGESVNNVGNDTLRIEIINTTTARVTRGVSTNNAIYDYQIVEYRGVKSRQSGNVTLSSSGDTDTAITAVDTSKSIAYVSTSTTSGGNSYLYRAARYRLTSSTNIRINVPIGSQIAHYQILEFY